MHTASMWQGVGDKRVFVVESHHHVLDAWAECHARLAAPLTLITFDFHTDTRFAFARRIGNELRAAGAGAPSLDALETLGAERVATIDWKTQKSRRDAITRLWHDEHIHVAKLTGIVSHVFVLLGGRTGQNEPKFAQVIPASRACACEGVHSPECERALCDELLEDSVLVPKLAQIEDALDASVDGTPFILDIDLDCFRTLRALQPERWECFAWLLSRAACITVALEPGCVGILRLPGEYIVSADLWRELQALIRRV